MLEICRLTIVESLRRRLTLALFGSTLLLVGFTGWAFSEISRLSSLQGVERLAQLSVLMLFLMLLLTGMFALTAVFTAAAAVAGELESGVAAAILARPLRRASYLFGKWLGLAVVVAAFALLAGSGEILVVSRVSGYAAPDPVAALALITGQALLLMTLSLALATRLSAVTSAVVATVGFFLAWMLGTVDLMGVALRYPSLMTAGEIGKVLLPTNALWQAAEYYLEPSALISLVRGFGMLSGDPFVSLAPQPPAVFVWAAIWTALVLALGIWGLARRQI
jgi:ABC-type transport system involved in multi-copper enzyme maturation permease subunit